MASSFTFRDYLTDNLDMNAQIVSDILHQVREVLQENEALAKLVDYVIKYKGANEISRLSKLLSYEVDNATIELLEEYHQLWFADPSLFHNRIKSSQSVVLDPWAQAVREHLQTEQDNSSVNSSERIADRLSQSGIAPFEQLKDIVDDMLNAASRYKHLEKGLGSSIALVLGNKISETSWTKLLPKSKESFNQVIQRFRAVRLPEYSVKYARLEERLILYKLGIFLGQVEAIRAFKNYVNS